MSQISCDVLVIGAGAGGSALSWRLSSNSNLRVICVEQGKASNPEDYPSNYQDWEVQKDFTFSHNPKRRPDFASFPYDDTRSPIKISYFSGVGGSTVLFSGHFPRFHPSDFCSDSLDKVGADWPLTYEDLEEYYELNDRNIGVAGLHGDPAYPPIRNLLPPVPLGLLGEKVATAMNALGWHWWPSYSAINTSRRFSNSTCVNLGPCNTGCAQGAKSSSDIRYWPKAVSNGVELITNMRVIRLNAGKSELVKSATALSLDGRILEIAAKIFVIAGNGVWTPHLLLNSQSEKFPDGLANRSGLVGRNLMLHPLVYVEGQFKEDINSSLGPQGCCIIGQEFFETNPSRGFKRGFTMQVLRSSGPLDTMRQAISRGQAQFGANFHDDFARIFNKTIGISMIVEDLPDNENRVSLSESRDSFGMQIPEIHYQLGENTRKIMSFAIDKGEELLKEMNATNIVKFGPVGNAGWHLMGTTRMGTSNQNSVTNKFGQCHDVPNLFVADGSLFPTSSSVNPTSTIQALALHIADFIKDNFVRIGDASGLEQSE